MKNRLIKALKREKPDRPPIWFMRQAGRYLPEYQALRAKHSFWKMVTTPELAAEVTLQPIERFDLDAAIIFSDILVILHGLGFDVSFETGPPVLSKKIANDGDLKALINEYSGDAFLDRLKYFQDSLSLTRKSLAVDKSLIGFAAAPFTLASYMIEGETSKFHSSCRSWMHRADGVFNTLLQFIVDQTIQYLKMQIEAGAEVVQIFDSWADIVASKDYKEKLMPFNEKVVSAISKQVPVIFFCKGASIHREVLTPLFDAGASALSIDWRIDIEYFKEKTVQGNLDPSVLFTNPRVVHEKVKGILEKRAKQPGYIFNLGHGIYPKTPVENVESMVSTVQNFQI